VEEKSHKTQVDYIQESLDRLPPDSLFAQHLRDQLQATKMQLDRIKNGWHYFEDEK
jgi:hypothetical protein